MDENEGGPKQENLGKPSELIIQNIPDFKTGNICFTGESTATMKIKLILNDRSIFEAFDQKNHMKNSKCIKLHFILYY